MGLLSRAYKIARNEGIYTLTIEILQWMRNQPYRVGNNRICPVCGYKSRKFKPDGTPTRKECQCFNCGARERHRFLWYYITTKTDILETNNKVLYFAPTGNIPNNLKQQGNSVLTTDLKADNIHFLSDITQLPVGSNEFDVIICQHVLEHVPNDHAAMRELHRVLKPDGDGLIMVPVDESRKSTFEDSSITTPEQKYQKFGHRDHVRVYSPDFKDRLSDVGFNVGVYSSKNTDSSIVKKHGFKIHTSNHVHKSDQAHETVYHVSK